MTIDQLLPWIVAANTLMVLGTAIVMALTSGSRKTAGALDAFKKDCSGRFDTLDSALDDHARRIQFVESEMKHLPDREMVHQLQLTLKDIQIEMAGIKATTEQASRTSRRVEEFLIQQGSGGA